MIRRNDERYLSIPFGKVNIYNMDVGKDALKKLSLVFRKHKYSPTIQSVSRNMRGPIVRFNGSARAVIALPCRVFQGLEPSLSRNQLPRPFSDSETLYALSLSCLGSENRHPQALSDQNYMIALPNQRLGVQGP
jgi:hypothetical protein